MNAPDAIVKPTRSRVLLAPLTALLVFGFAACDGSTKVGEASVNTTRLQLDRIEIGRLVDIYAYRRIDLVTRGDRRDRFNRKPVLIAKDIVINPAIETQSLFDPAGEEVQSADYQFLSFDVATGHEELMILWDDRTEAAQFQDALKVAQEGLLELPAAYRNQNTATRPMPVVPRNAALVLRFRGRMTIDNSFFAINQSAVQLLEFKGDPATMPAPDAFRSVDFRTLVRDNTIIIDPTLLGGEASGGFLSAGMPPSTDQVTANIRIAIPSRGSISSAFYVREDQVAELNDTDSFGRDSVIRDFRSGNSFDGAAGALRDLEAPMIVGALDMGITAVNAAANQVTLNKHFHQVPVRARYPFTEGTLRVDAGSGEILPTGPAGVPTTRPLRAGDYLEQVVEHTNRNGGVESVRVRAEILWNLQVGTVRDDPNFPGPGLAVDGTQGEALPTIVVGLASVAAGVDSLGDPVSFRAPTGPNPDPEGEDCVVRTLYYEDVRFQTGGNVVSDNARRYEYLKIEPPPSPATPGAGIDPNVTVAIEFTEPMDIVSVDPTTNLVLTNSLMPAAPPGSPVGTVDFADLIRDAKLANSGVVPTRLSDQKLDATVPQLQPPKGLFHLENDPAGPERYWFHMLLGNGGVTDLGGNQLEVFADPSRPARNWSVSLTLDPLAESNLVGWRVFRFENIDEDGTPAGSVDIFGQYRFGDGRLTASETLRFRRTADVDNLGAISRILRGECWDATADAQLVPINPANGGALYWQPAMVDVVFPPNVPPVFLPPNSPQNVGQVIEPHQPRGSRMMMRYLEDDFDLSYRQPADFMVDVEQLYWSPFNDYDILFDVFDRYTMLLSHSDKRPDLFFFVNPQGANMQPECQLACPSISSSLGTTFLSNVPSGSTQTPVFEDKVYQINPNDAFRSPFNRKYLAYPRFDRRYTWRDSRLVTVDGNGNVVGLGGARNPGAPEPNNDWTANIDTPWAPSVPDPEFPGPIWVMDPADFHGDRQRDHDPIAMPLLVDFKMFPDNASNGIASGVNGFQVAMIGPPSAFIIGNPGGYYNMVGVGCPNRDPWPLTRVHTTGGIDPNTNQDIYVDPANAFQATGGWIKDAGAIVMIGAGAAGNGQLGIFRAPPGDSMINWASADFVRRVSTMTFGFFDTLRPNWRAPNAPGEFGIPNFLDNDIVARFGDVRILDMVTQLDPPRNRQPAGTSVVLEIRGASTFANSGTVYDRVANNAVPDPPAATGRGNLLNSDYACEAYRYSRANSGAGGTTPRVAATGLTRYVTEDRIGDIREPTTGLLPRFLNLRLVMTNNIDVTPALSPSLRSLSLIYRMEPVGQ